MNAYSRLPEKKTVPAIEKHLIRKLCPQGEQVCMTRLRDNRCSRLCLGGNHPSLPLPSGQTGNDGEIHSHRMQTMPPSHMSVCEASSCLEGNLRTKVLPSRQTDPSGSVQKIWLQTLSLPWRQCQTAAIASKAERSNRSDGMIFRLYLSLKSSDSQTG